MAQTFAETLQHLVKSEGKFCRTPEIFSLVVLLD